MDGAIETVEITGDMRVIHSHYGDLTEEVAALLLEESQAENIVDAAVAEERQRHIAATCGQEATHMKHGHVIAQIDESVFSYWEAREGREFWKHEMGWFLKRHPECAVRSRAANPSLLVDGLKGGTMPATAPAGATGTGRRGRWGL